MAHSLRRLVTSAMLVVALFVPLVQSAAAAPIVIPGTSSDAPLSQQPIPQSANYSDSGIRPMAVAKCPYPQQTAPVAGTTRFSGVALSFPTSDGDMLAGTAFATDSSHHYLAVGGNFKNIIDTKGVRHPATNFAVISEETGAVVYSGTGINSYVWSVKYAAGVLYLGGDFTTISGSARAYIAAIAFPTGKLTSWNPGSPSKVRAIAVGTNSVYYAGASSYILAVRPITGAKIWTQRVTGGPVLSLLLSPGGSGLFVGGLFETIGSLKQHGLAELFPTTTGAVYTPFKPVLKADSGVGPEATYDGQEGISLAWDLQTTVGHPLLVLGWGGGTTNGVAQVVPASGHFNWARDTEGDTQGVSVVGNVYIGGNHRNHGNNIGCGYSDLSTAFASKTGTVLAYMNFYLSGGQPNTDGGNGGIRPVINDTLTHKLFLLGAFTTYGATCNATFSSCTGGRHLQSIAEFSYA